MGFFNDLKEDIAQAYNELTDENAEKEIEMEQAKLMEELQAMELENSSEASFDFEDAIPADDNDELDPFIRSIIEGSDDSDIDIEETLNDEANDAFITLEEVEESALESVDNIDDVVNADDLAELEEQFRAQLELLGVDESQPVVEAVVEEPIVEPILEPIEEPVVEPVEEMIVEDVMPEAPEESGNIDSVEEPVAEVIVCEKIEESEVEEMVIDNSQVVEERIEEVSETKRVATDETSLITQGLTVKGNIESNGNVEILGKVIGDIECLGKLNVAGIIEGNSKASEVFCDAAKITGEISATGTVKVGQSSVIIGNVIATSAVIAGAVKGDIDVKGPVILDASAIVMGNIKSKSVQINNGAVIDGKCSQCYADVNPVAFFENL